MPQPIRTAIAGLGRSGWAIHANLLAPLTDLYRVVAVVDGEETRREEARARFGCSAHTDFGDLVANDDIELIVVALPSFLHADLTVQALEAGKHVVCEKPMADSLPDATRMVEASRANPGTLSIFQQRRYNPDFVKVREIIDSGVLGRIVQIRMTENRFGRRWDWQTLQRFGGGSLNNTGPHYLDQALQLFGPKEPEVFCVLDRTLTLGDADDHVKVVIKAEGQPTIDIEISSACVYPGESWNVMGTQGGLQGNSLWGNRGELKWSTFDPADLEPRVLTTEPTPDRSYNRDVIPWQEHSWSPPATTEPVYTQYYRDLFETLRNGADLKITPESVHRVIQLQERCHELAPLDRRF